MALRLTAGAAQDITNANPNPFLAAGSASYYPFTVGIWSFATVDPGTGMIWSIGQSGAGRNSINVGVVSSFYAVNVDNGAQFQSVSSSLGTATGRWIFLLGRFISTANRWIITLDSRGAITQTQGTTSVPFAAAFTRLNIGNRADGTGQGWISGYAAESWYADLDVGVATGPNSAMDTTLIRKLAYVGPFSVPWISQQVIEYHSLRYEDIFTIASMNQNNRDNYFSKYPASFFKYGTAGTNPASTLHPPLESSYMPPPNNTLPLRNFSMVGGGGAGAAFRRTLSPFGARTGSRQIQGYMNG